MHDEVRLQTAPLLGITIPGMMLFAQGEMVAHVLETRDQIKEVSIYGSKEVTQFRNSSTASTCSASLLLFSMLASHTRTVCKRTCLSASKPSQRKVKQRAYHLSKKLKDSAVDDAEPYYKRMKGVRLTGRSIYLDMQATTPIDPRVVDSMMPYWTEQFGNPHSRSQMYGWENEEACEIAREV